MLRYKVILVDDEETLGFTTACSEWRVCSIGIHSQPVTQCRPTHLVNGTRRILDASAGWRSPCSSTRSRRRRRGFRIPRCRDIPVGYSWCDFRPNATAATAGFWTASCEVDCCDLRHRVYTCIDNGITLSYCLQLYLIERKSPVTVRAQFRCRWLSFWKAAHFR